MKNQHIVNQDEIDDFTEWLKTQPQYRALLGDSITPTADVVREVMGGAGSALGAGANAAAHNRGVQFDADIERARLRQQAERDFYDQVLAREAEGRQPAPRMGAIEPDPEYHRSKAVHDFVRGMFADDMQPAPPDDPRRYGTDEWHEAADHLLDLIIKHGRESR